MSNLKKSQKMKDIFLFYYGCKEELLYLLTNKKFCWKISKLCLLKLKQVKSLNK